MQRVLLFVYGTLMRGEAAHALLGPAARFIGEGRTEPAFTLLDLGDYPALASGGDTAVAGELYEIDSHQLAALDDYEDAPALYERLTIRVGEHDAVAYLLRAEHSHGRSVIASGAWRRRSGNRVV